MRSSGAVGAFSERWPETQEVLRLANAVGAHRPEIEPALAALGDTPQRHLAEAILMLWSVDYRPSRARVEQITARVGAAVERAPADPYVRLYAAMVMLDMRDLRQAAEHLKALRDHTEEFTGPKAQAALLHVVGRVVAGTGRDLGFAEDALITALELDPTEAAYRTAVDHFLNDDRQIIGGTVRPPIDQMIHRLPL